MAMRKQYRGSGSSGLGRILSFIAGGGEGDFEGAELNQPIDDGSFISNDPSNYGQIVQTPAFDTRNWLQRRTGVPNTASDINTRALMGNIQGQQANKFKMQGMKEQASFEDERFPTILDQLEQELSTREGVKQQSELRKSALESVNEPVLANTATMGSLPFNLPISPEQGESLISSALESGQPFVPVNTRGVLENAKLAEEKSQQALRTSAIAENARPRYSSVGNTLFRTDDAGARPEYTVEQGYDKDFSFDPVTKQLKPGGRVPSRVISHRPVGNIYSGQGGAVSPPALYDINNLRGPASTQRQEYVTALGPDGSPPVKMESQGEAPKTQPEVSVTSRQPTGVAPSVLDIFSPEMQEMAKTEFGRRIIRKLQSQAWDPISPTYGY